MLQAKEQTRTALLVTEKFSHGHHLGEGLLSFGLPALWRLLFGFLEIPVSDTCPQSLLKRCPAQGPSMGPT